MKCATCKYWNTIEDGSRGECRRHPPSEPDEPQQDQPAEDHHRWGVWLMTRNGDWCGEHVPVEHSARAF